MFNQIKSFIDQLKRNKTNSILTMLCIAICTCFIILVFNLSIYISKSIRSETEKHDPIAIIANGKYSSKGDIDFAIPKFSRKDIQGIKDSNPFILDYAMSTIKLESKKILYKTDLFRVRNITQVDYSFLSIYELKILYGSFISKSDVESKKNVAVINNDTAIKVFGDAKNAIGKSIDYIVEKEDMNGLQSKKEPFIIIGVIKDLSEYEALTLGLGDIMIPVSFFNNELKYEKIIVKLKKDSTFSMVISRLIGSLKTQYSDELKIINWRASPENFNVNKIIRAKKMQTYSIIAFFNFLGIIIMIVGGFSIFSTMLARGIDQRKSIGLKLALGYTQGRIISTILLESTIYIAGGAFIGTFFAFIINKAFISKLSPLLGSDLSNESNLGILYLLKWESISSGILITFIIGLLFSIIPAIIASNSNPIESLKDN